MIDLTKENIIEEVHNDLELFDNKNTQKESKCDKYMCRFSLFQFFQLKYMNNKNRDFVGYIMNFIYQKDSSGNLKKTYSLDNSYISTLNRANILKEIKEIKYNDDYFDLINQYYTEEKIKKMFLEIIKTKNLDIDTNLKSTYELFNLIKEKDEKIFYSYTKKTLKNGDIGKKFYINTENNHFLFRYFKLSEKYQEVENILFEKLKDEFGWRLNYKISRDF